jgi:predicted peptidase
MILGAALMAEANSFQVEPGHQLPERLTVHASGKHGAADVTMPYLLFVPKDYRADGKKWPLMLFLHGVGECGNGDLPRVKTHGPPKIAESRPDFPFVVISPQLPPPKGYKQGTQYTYKQLHEMVDDAWQPEPLAKLVDFVMSKLNVDRERFYVTGLSMGGYGTWRFVAAYPERVAAAVPICGGGEPDTMAKSLSKVPIWSFHGGKDQVVRLEEDQKLIEAVKRAGGNVRLTVYPEAMHDSWTATYKNPKVFDWLLSHQRKSE